MAAPTGRDSDKFMLRLPDGMRDEIEATAKENGRSMNAEIVVRLGRPYLDLSDEGIIALFKRLEATTEGLEELYFSARDFDIDAVVEDLKKKSEMRLTRAQAVRHIIQDWLTAHGYLPNPAPKKDEN
jgi:hypothetical protein